MIGSLARFENIFGYLWENDTKEGDKFAEMWEYARNSILNNGNKQARAAINELTQYLSKGQIKFNDTYKFYFDNNTGDNK